MSEFVLVCYIQLKKLYQEGVIDARSKCWATGLETWKPLSTIAQLKWFIIAEKQLGLLNESQLARVILDTLIQVVSFCPAKNGEAIIRPVHKAKQILSVEQKETRQPDTSKTSRFTCLCLRSLLES